MASATLQPPPPTKTNNPQLKRLVYSKYREMLGSYNGKANDIIQSMPGFLVHEDKGFNFNNNSDVSDDVVDYRAPPAPPLPNAGGLQGQRLQTQMMNEAPACVQNAMMTKDKKPFTYTPGGLDLSQIKSPRMAKRIARNAQYEGVTGQPKPSPLAQPTSTQTGVGSQHSPPIGPSMAAQGMPVQVFPTGPPPPPPPIPSNKGQQLAPQNGNGVRKSPSPSQNFEPPPLGCRPEIKIPPNPMASLRKVPQPKSKDDFWIEEYRNERSKSPAVHTSNNTTNNNDDPSEQSEQEISVQPSPAEPARHANTQNTIPSESPSYLSHTKPQSDSNTQTNIIQNTNSSTPQYHYRPPSPVKSQPPSLEQQQVSTSRPNQTQYEKRAVSPARSVVPPQQRASSPARPTVQYQPQMQSAYPQSSLQTRQTRTESPFSAHDNPNLQRPLSPIRVQSRWGTAPKTEPLQQQAYSNSISNNNKQQKSVQVGSLYIPPVAPENLAPNLQQPQQSYQPAPQSYQRPQETYQQPQEGRRDGRWQSVQPEQKTNPQTQQQRPGPVANAQTPPWLQSKIASKDVPDWVREASAPPAQQQRVQSPPINTSHTNNGTGLRVQIQPTLVNSNPKERIIPIQLEQTPTPTRTPTTPGFGPQPFYGGSNQQQYGSVSSPSTGNSSPQTGGYTSPVIRNPNHFVDQGYNNYPAQQQQQWPSSNRVSSPNVQQSPQPSRTRTIPIAVEGQDGASVRGPVLQSPTVIQNDPRTQNQNNQAWSNGGPNQSKSFRVLQKITDTDVVAGNQSDDERRPSEIQRPQYSRQIGGQTTAQNSPPIEQMKRMQIIDDQNQSYPPVQNSGDTSSSKSSVDPRYCGSNIPSRSFKLLQNLVGSDDEPLTTDAESDVPIMSRPQPPRYVQQRPIWQTEAEQQHQPYVPPSEQTVPEPKKYTGSAIPSRSFKILQAMTTPENADEMETSEVPYEQSETPLYYYSDTPYPYPPPYFNPNDPSNWHYFYPPPPHYYYHPDNGSQKYSNGECYNNERNEYNNKRATPNIVISCENKSVDTGNEEELKFKIPALRLLSEKLDSISKIDVEQNISKDDKHYLRDQQKEMQEENKSLSKDDCMDSSSGLSDFDTDTDEESDHKCAYMDGLQAIKSVTDINFYNFQDFGRNDQTFEDCTDSLSLDSDEEAEEIEEVEEIEEEEEGEIEQVEEIEEEEADVEEVEEIEEEEDEIEEVTEEAEDFENQSDSDMEEIDEIDDEEPVLDTLSVILEESEFTGMSRERPESQNSLDSSQSECTTTIANDDDDIDTDDDASDILDQTNNRIAKEDFESKNEEKEEEVAKHFIATIRLPLKFTFSKTSQDLEEENVSTKAEEDDDCDVSVSFSLPSRSSSRDKNNEDSDSEVSISVSLPMKRNKFMNKTLKGGVTNDICFAIGSENNEADDPDESGEELEAGETSVIDVIEEEDEEVLKGIEDEREKEAINISKANGKDEALINQPTSDFRGKMWKEAWFFNHCQEEDEDPWGFRESQENKTSVAKEGNQTISNDKSEEQESDESDEVETDEDSEDEILEEMIEKVENVEEITPTIENSLKTQPVFSLRESIEKTTAQNGENNEFWINNRSYTPYPNLIKLNHENPTIIEPVEELRLSVRKRIADFEKAASPPEVNKSTKLTANITEDIRFGSIAARKEALSRNSSLQKSESEVEEDDSGVTSDMSKPISETDTDTEFPELRKMTSYQRAATHSRLFKLLQDECLAEEALERHTAETTPTTLKQRDEFEFRPSRKKIVHNVSITRKTNPEAIKNAETMSERRERLSLPLKASNSIDADNVSSSNSPCSPMARTGSAVGTEPPVISEKLVNELVQSLLLQKKSFSNLPLEKLQAAAKKALEEEMDSLGNSSKESTPAVTPQELRTGYQSSYSDYYDSWENSRESGAKTPFEILPSKAFMNLHDQSVSGQKKSWAPRCPRVLSSKTVNRDLARVTELRESESPENRTATRASSCMPSSPPVLQRPKDFIRGQSVPRFSGKIL